MTTCSCIFCPIVELNLQLCDVIVKRNRKTLVCHLPTEGMETYNPTQRGEIAELMVRAVLMGEEKYGNAAGNYSNSSVHLHIERLGKNAYKLCVHAKETPEEPKEPETLESSCGVM